MRDVVALQKGEVLLSVLAILVFNVLTFSPCQTATAADGKTFSRQKPDAVDLAQKIERVESGLLPPAVLKSETPVRMRLADRMRFYQTPGVSIAVINNRRIEWAR